MEEYIFEEFYISSNPPLLPRGVEEVITLAKQTLHEKLLEILYDPEGPWFKLITGRCHRAEATLVIQDALISIGEEDVSPLDLDADGSGNPNQRGEREDVEVFGEMPRMIPWVTCEKSLKSSAGFFDSFRFPDQMSRTQYRAVWRCPVEGIDDVLEAVAQTWLGSEIPLSLEDMGPHLDCQLSHSLRKTVLYIGSNDSVEKVQRATQKLDGIVSAKRFASTPSITHIIAIGGETRVKIGYRWLSHVGLSRRTYDFNVSSSASSRGATLRAAVEPVQGHDEWRMDRSYPITGANKPNTSRQFSVFANYVYPTKEPGTKTTSGSVRTGSAVADVEGADSSQAVPGSHEISRLITSASFRENPRNIEDWVRTLPKTEDHVNVDAPKMSLPGVSSVSGRSTPALHNPPLLDSNESEPAQEHLPDILEIGVTESQIQSSTREPSTGGPLESESPNMGRISWECMPLTPRQNQYCKPARVGIQIAHEPSDLLMDLADQGPSLPEYKPLTTSGDDTSKSPHAVEKSGENGWDGTLDELLFFGIKEDPPKEIRRTMNQRAGRKRKSPSKNIHNNRRPIDARKQETGEHERFQPSAQSSDGRPWNDVVRGRPVYRNDETGRSVMGKSISPNYQAEITHTLPIQVKADVRSNVEPQGIPNHILEDVSSQMKQMARILQEVPGKVKLELKLGRLWFDDLSDADVYSDGSGPLWKVGEMQRYLNETTLHHNAVFQSILSSGGEDADKLAHIRAPCVPRWDMPEKSISYEFTCSLERNNSNTPFKIIVNAETFEPAYLGLDQEVSSMYVHWPEFAWDFKVCATRARLNGLPVECKEYTEHLVSSLAVITDGAETVRIEVAPPWDLGVTIEGVEIRHVARYKSKANNSSQLTVVMTRPLVGDINSRKTQSIISFRSYFVATRGKHHGLGEPGIPGKPGEWFEAHLSSWRAEDVFLENAGIELGQSAGWTAEVLEEAGVFHDICRPALGMIPRMDDIGLANANDPVHVVGSSRGEETSATGSGQKKYEYW